MKVLYTIGSSSRTEEDFVRLLKEKGISLLVDVRSKHGSRVMHFDESRFHNLSSMLARHGIAYDESLHLSLGGLQNGKMTLGNFRRYASTEEFRTALAALKEKISANTSGETVILCCELDPKKCHRGIIAERITGNGDFKAVHL